MEYDAVQHGYKVSRRPYDFEELRLLAECVHASKFISKSQEEHLLAAIENLCSDYQIEELQNEVYLVGRNKTTNKHIMATMLKVNQAIRMDKQISFRYGLCGIGKNKSPVLSYVIAEGLKIGLSNAILSVN